MTPSKVLFYFCITFAVGIFFESFANIPILVLWGFLVGATVFIVVGFFKKEAMVIGFCLLALVLGVTRLQMVELTILQDPISRLNGSPEKVTLNGIIIAQPDVRAASQKLKIQINGTQSTILVTTHRYPEYRYLDALQLIGKLKEPQPFNGFNYKKYLAKDGIYSVMDFPTIEIIPTLRHQSPATYMYEKILSLKQALVHSINNNFSPPDSSLLEGVVFGNDKTMPEEVKNQFNATGLSHITAVSGTNIVILISILMACLLALGFWRGQAFYAAVILIWLYIIMIGFPVSGIRAAIMGCVGLLASKLGRQNTSGRVLTTTGAVMLLENPMLLAFDISFQLSFLASLGIIYIKPLIDYYLAFTTKEHFKYWLDVVSVTLAAQIITLPIIVYNFGTVSLISPIANFLVVPIIPLLTMLGLAVSVAGVFSTFLGFLFSLPCLVITFYVMKVVGLFSGPWAQAKLEHVSSIWMAVYYVALVVGTMLLKARQRPKFLG